MYHFFLWEKGKEREEEAAESSLRDTVPPEGA